MSFLRNSDGATSIEYGLIACLIALALITGAMAAGNGVASLFGDIGAVMQVVTAGL